MSSSSTMTVTSGSSIDGNTASKVSSPAFALASSSLLVRRGAIGARSLRKRDFAMGEHEGKTALTRASARRREEAPTCSVLPR